MSEVNITVVGNVATEPKLDKNKNEEAFAHFRLACNNARYDSRSRSWVDDETSFYTVYCWRSPLAENITASLRKGDPVVVYGRLKNREWRDKNDVPRVSPEITARSLGHDLYRGTSSFTKVTRPPVIPDDDDAVESVRAMYASGEADQSDGGGHIDGNGGPAAGLWRARGELPPGDGRPIGDRPGGGVGRGGTGLGGAGSRNGAGGSGGDDALTEAVPVESGNSSAASDPLANVGATPRPAARSRREKAGAPA